MILTWNKQTKHGKKERKPPAKVTGKFHKTFKKNKGYVLEGILLNYISIGGLYRLISKPDKGITR